MIDPRTPDYSWTPVASERPMSGLALHTTPEVPAVSVVTPVFNPGDELAETGRSVLQQSLQNFEWLLINDGSTDEASLASIDRWRGADPRIRVVDLPENRGLSGARNEGYRQARAELVFQLDDDDLIEPTALEKMALFLASWPEYSFVQGFVVGFGARDYLWEGGFHDGPVLLDENRATAMAMVRRAVHEAVGGYDEGNREGLEDWEFWLKCAAAGYWGATIPEYLGWYRQRRQMADRWSNRGRDIERFGADLRARFGTLRDSFPCPQATLTPPESRFTLENPVGGSAPRILMIYPWTTLGGADRFNLDAIGQLRRLGWDVSVVTTHRDNHEWLPAFTCLTPDVFTLHHFARPQDHPHVLRWLIDSRRPDVVLLSNSEPGYHLLPWLRHQCPSPAYVTYNHMEQEDWKDGGYPARAVDFQESLDLNIVSSGHLKVWMAARGGERDRIEVCTTNRDTALWRPDAEARRRLRDEHGVAEDTPVVLYSGRLCAQKQPRVFAKVMQELASSDVNYVALVAGDGEDRSWLESFIERHGLQDRVRMLGEVSIDAMPSLVAASDVYFLPSQWEGIALSVYEAMACGVPVVGADVGGQRELVTPETGVLITRSTEEAEAREYVAILHRLLEDATVREEMGRAARHRIEAHFSLDAMGDRLVQLLELAMTFRQERGRAPVSGDVAVSCLDGVEAYFGLSHAPAGIVAHDRRVAAEVELARIESSRAWRLVQCVKRSAPYRVAARARFGADWDEIEIQEDAERRLARLRASRPYRFIECAKRTRVYRVARSKRGG